MLCAIAPIAGLLAPTARAAVQLSGVSYGAASVSQAGSITNIRTSNNAVLNFSQFNITAGSTVDFIQPSSASRELNLINSAAPSAIDGALISNGTVYLVNPAGVIFGGGASVDVNRLYVAGSHMAESDFLSGVDHFTDVSGTVSNAGQIHANGAFLIGSQVINTGSIVAPGGVVAMLSGSDVLISNAGSHVAAKVVPVAAPGSATAAGSSASQFDLRNSPMAAGDAYSFAIRHTGYIQANSVLMDGGSGKVQVSGTINASNTAAGSTGGTVQISGGQIALASATITVDGPAGGGLVQIGGGPHESDSLSEADFLTLDLNTTINADATEDGNGGHIVLWASNTTEDSATLTARGGPLGGNGGTIETSADDLEVTVAPNESAPRGELGTWFLDPQDMEIISSTVTSTGQISASTIDSALMTGNFVVTTNTTGVGSGNLTQDADALISVALTSPATLVLQGNATIDLHGGITSNGTSALTVEIDALGGPTSTVTIDTTPININGPLSILGGTVIISDSLTATNMTIASGTSSALAPGGTFPVTTGVVTIDAPLSSGTVAIGGTSLITGAGTAGISGSITATGGVTLTTSGAISIAAPITSSGGSFTAGGTSFTTTTSTSGTTTINGTINATGGGVILTTAGPISIGAAVTATDQPFTATSATTFTTSGSGSITTGGGALTLISTGTDSIGAAISTSGGIVSMTGAPEILTSTVGTISSGAGNITLSAGASGVSTGAAITTTTGTVALTSAGGSVTSAGPITTTGGAVLLTATSGSVMLPSGGTISSGAGNVTLTSGSAGVITSASITTTTGGVSLTSTDGGILLNGDITSGGGPVSLTATATTAVAGSGEVTTGTLATISTGGGNLTITAGQSFTQGGPITDGGSTTASQVLTINTTSGTGSIQLSAATTWGGPENSIIIEGDGTIVLNTGATITETGTNAVGLSILAEGASSNSVTINGIINVSGPFSSNGGTFDVSTLVPSPTAALTALSISIDTSTVTSGTIALSNGSVSLGGGIVTDGGPVIIAGTTALFTTQNGTITTDGGALTVTNTGLQSIGGTINTSATAGTVGGAVSFTGGTDVTIGSSDPITTGGGNVTIDTAANSTSQSEIQSNINTDGGSFTLSSPAGFIDEGLITDNDVPLTANNSTNSCSIISNATGSSISGVTVTWEGGTGRSVFVEGNGSVDVDTVTSTGTGPLEVSVYSTASNGTVEVDGAVNTTGDFISSGGAFTLESSASITALSVQIGTQSTTPDSSTLTPGAATVSGPIVTQPSATDTLATNGVVTIFSTAFTSSGTGAITTNGGAVNITCSGAVSITAPVSTLGGAFSSSSQSTFDAGSGGTISTGGGNVSISGLTSVGVDDQITTSGGNFTATGGTFENSAEISDGGVNDSKPGGLSITTSTGDITIGGEISWASSLSPITFSVPSGSSVALGAEIIANAAEPINFSSAPISLTTTSAEITGGSVTLGDITDGTSSQNPELTIQASGSVSLQTVGTSTDPIGGITIQANGSSAAPTTTLNGDINVAGNAIFAGNVSIPATISITSAGTNTSDFGDLEFDGTIEGPGGLNLTTSEQVRMNGNVGDVTPLAFLDINSGSDGITFFSAGPAGTTGFAVPGIGEQASLLTVDIVSGGSFEVNDVSPNPRVPVDLFATIAAYGPVDINIGSGSAANASNLYAVGENEKFTDYGSLDINTNGGTIQTGDISTFSNMTLQASSIVFELRPPAVNNGQEVDLGMDLIAGGTMNLPSGAAYSGTGSGQLDVPGFIAQSFGSTANIAQIANQFKTTFSIIGGIEAAALFGEDNFLLDLTPSTLSVSIPSFVPPTPGVFDYPIAGPFPREIVTAGNVPFDFKMAWPPVYPGPVTEQEINDSGINTRDPSTEEILGQVGTMAVYDDLPDSPRPSAAEYKVVVNRLDPKRVEAYLQDYQSVFGANPAARRTQINSDFQAAWDFYVTENGDQPVSGRGFAQFCKTAAVAGPALADLHSLSDLRTSLGQIGLSYKEAQVAFQYNVLSGMGANGMREGDLAAAVAETGAGK